MDDQQVEDALVDVLDTVDNLIRSKEALSGLLRKGFIALAQARYSLGSSKMECVRYGLCGQTASDAVSVKLNDSVQGALATEGRFELTTRLSCDDNSETANSSTESGAGAIDAASSASSHHTTDRETTGLRHRRTQPTAKSAYAPSPAVAQEEAKAGESGWEASETKHSTGKERETPAEMASASASSSVRDATQPALSGASEASAGSTQPDPHGRSLKPRSKGVVPAPLHPCRAEFAAAIQEVVRIANLSAQLSDRQRILDDAKRGEQSAPAGR